ncbi:ATP synthase F1 subunit epsilon [Pontibacter sp. FD36]|uniref:ATP synthase F1 subcomplex epsilon subunit n=1 Tax=Pontibacter lucknowensis TaxID=1077936 RepID=A0A1N6T5W0_9BACT|nr:MULTISPECIES: ATP synthase F1 subunit epsilon [Pontibacter]EJF09464.1 H+transporting two-sector ATPase delta/subunit epsilon [Pontibacter sp. BAB1700]MBF8961955.1 ATP synthase F1 subunit epsilon [Pontibacter sp. FD36]SIQ48795.1 ATP synthase F1 subcomplex epsilon subunit [Pontibacter lucknowensis]
MYLEIITPDKKVFAGEVEAAQFPGTNGSFEVLDSHAPLISTLENGRIRITTAQGQTFYNVDGGVVEVLNNKIIVLAESVSE